MNIDAIRREAENFVREAEAITYRNHAGLTEGGGLAALHDRFPRVFGRESLAHVEASLAIAPEGPEKLRRELLRELLVHALIDRETDAVADELMAREAASRIELPDGSVLPYRSVPAEVARESARGRRRAIEAKHAEVLYGLDPLYREWWHRTRRACGALGHPDLAALVGETARVDLDALAASAMAFLRDTNDLYRDYLGWMVRRYLTLTLAELERHDLSHLFHFPNIQSTYPASDLVPLAGHTMSDIGLSLDAGGRITLDLEARKGKSSRAFCARLQIPQRIVLVILPRGGQDDYEAFFHELGHALHFAHVDAGLPFELRDLDDSSVTEAWAFTFQSLSSDPLWVATFLKEKPGKDFFRALKLAKLFLVRRYAAKIVYELDLWRAPALDDLPDRYAARLRAATGALYPVEGFLADVDPFFYVARYLRGWMLSSQIIETLRDRFDEGWFRRPPAGKWLRAKWQVGAMRAESLSRDLGCERLDAAALTREFLDLF